MGRLAAFLCGWAALPACAGTAPPHPADTVPLLQISLSLLAVLLAIFAIAWFARRYLALGGQASGAIRVVGGLQVGNRERVLLLEVGEQWLVIGVAPGRIDALATLPRQELPSSATSGAPGGFAASLAARMRTIKTPHDAH